MTAQEELLRLVPPPADVAVHIEWGQVEDDLGVALPDDYKWLAEQYGPGSFDEFLSILHPSSPFYPTRLVEAAERAAEILDQLHASGREKIPYETNDLLAVGKTDNGDTIYWVTDPQDTPNAWKVVANGARNTKWPRFDGGIVEFLVAVLSGAARIDVFPRDFPSARPLFKPSPKPGGGGR